MRRTLAVWALALAVPGAAVAHVTIAPPFVEDGVETEISFATPNERPPRATVDVAVTAPPGLTIVSASAPAGWTASIGGSTVAWKGSRVKGRETASFAIHVLPVRAPGR